MTDDLNNALRGLEDAGMVAILRAYPSIPRTDEQDQHRAARCALAGLYTARRFLRDARDDLHGAMVDKLITAVENNGGSDDELRRRAAAMHALADAAEGEAVEAASEADFMSTTRGDR